ncbi:MAG TPA: MFS transporter [Anaerolineales bacterium]|nr:MFS transporter [Anaerolineales bacterium]
MLTIPPAFKHRQFVYLWVGLVISVIGSQMQVWALFWHIDQLTQQPLALGMVGAARVVPIVIFSIYGGAVADLFDRRKLLFLTQSFQALLSLMLFYLTVTQQIQLWHIYTITALQAVAFSFDLPARQALVPNLVPRETLPNALAMSSIAYQLGSILGPAASGLMIAGLGLQYTYLVDGISFGAVILALILMGQIKQDRSLRQTHKRVDMEMIREGLRFTFNNPLILGSMILDFLATFFVSANTMLPIFAREVLGVGPNGYGLLSAAQSTGALLTALILSQIKVIRHQGRTLLIAVVIFGFSAILFGASEFFWLSWFALALAGASDMVSMVIRSTIRQLQTPDSLRGRMTSVNQIFFAGGPQLGEIEAGVVGQFFGVQMAAISGGIACILGVGVATKIWPQLSNYQGDEENAIGEV